MAAVKEARAERPRKAKTDRAPPRRMVQSSITPRVNLIGIKLQRAR